MLKYKRSLILVVLVLVPILVLAGMFANLASARAPAATITVDTTDDELNSDGDCSLREAIQAANTDSAVDACTPGSGADTVVVPAGTYTLTIPGAAEDANATGDLDILDDLTLQGAGALSTTIDGNAQDRVLHVLTTTVEIQDVSIVNGFSPNMAGGGIRNQNGSLTLRDSIVAFNVSGGGGGLVNRATDGLNAQMTLDNVQVLNNTATDEFGGEGIAGGILNSPIDEGSMAILTVTHSLIAENQAIGASFIGGGGGGIFSMPSFCDTCGTTVAIMDSTIRDNMADYGGGIVNTRYQTTEDLTALLILERCTISGNTADASDAGAGGGIAAGGGTYQILNSTISDNHATSTGSDWEGMGGGIYALGYWGVPILDIQNTTIVSNTATNYGSGLSAYTEVGENPEVDFTSSIVANNYTPLGESCYNYNAIFTSQGNNLEDADTCEFDHLTDLVNTDPLLGPLQDNGGPTWTHALLQGSPAVDTIPVGTNGCGTTLTEDQRGVYRPQDGDGDGQALCDIGSYEHLVPTALTEVTIDGPLTGEVNASQTFTATVSPISATLPITYAWQAPGQAPVIHVDGNSDAVAYTWELPGSYAITVTASNMFSTVTDTHTIMVGEMPEASFVSNSPVVLGEMAAFTNTTTGTAPIEYLWDFGDNITSTLESPTHVYTATGTYTVTLTASNAFGSSQVSGVFVVEEEMMEVYIYLPLIPRLADE